MTAPTHLIMVLNRETGDLKLVSAHSSDYEAGYAFASLSSLFAATQNDVFKVTVPSECGFVDGEVVTAKGKAQGDLSAAKVTEAMLPSPMTSGGVTIPKPPRNGIHQNARGEYVQKLADGSEIISTSDFSD